MVCQRDLDPASNVACRCTLRLLEQWIASCGGPGSRQQKRGTCDGQTQVKDIPFALVSVVGDSGMLTDRDSLDYSGEKQRRRNWNAHSVNGSSSVGDCELLAW
jgi:hypothetical protein